MICAVARRNIMRQPMATIEAVKLAARTDPVIALSNWAKTRRDAWTKELFFVRDRGGGLLGRRGRQRRCRARLLRLRVGTGRFRRRRGGALAPGLRLGRRPVLIRRSRRRLQRWGGLCHLRIAGCDLRQRKTGYGKPRRDQCGGEKHILPVSALCFVRGHLVHRKSPAESTGPETYCSLGNGPS
jgi:hypothetical protein